MVYTAGEVAKKLHISKDTLRYYEKEGLLPPIQRDTSGHRVYSESDVEWIFLIRSLRDTDMPIMKIKCYVALLKHGGSESIPERRQILMEHQTFLHKKVVSYQNLYKLIEKKITFYDEALNPENSNTVACMDYAAEWEHFRMILEGMNNE